MDELFALLRRHQVAKSWVTVEIHIKDGQLAGTVKETITTPVDRLKEGPDLLTRAKLSK